MSLRLENLIFSHEKNNFLIVRAGRFTYFSFTSWGALVIKIKGFDRYYFDPETDEIYSRKGTRSFSPLGKQMDGQKPFYWLYKNGVRTRIYKAQILRENLREIEVHGFDPEPDPVKNCHLRAVSKPAA